MRGTGHDGVYYIEPAKWSRKIDMNNEWCWITDEAIECDGER